MSYKAKFYTDEHVHPAVAAALRQHGVDVLTAQEAGMLGASDVQHLALASSQGRIIVSRDKDFPRLHNNGLSHSGIVFYRQRTPIGDLVSELLLIYQIMEPEEMQDHIEYL